jgi:hypothetical protein
MSFTNRWVKARMFSAQRMDGPTQLRAFKIR